MDNTKYAFVDEFGAFGYDFVNHGKSIIMPMLSRLKTCNDVIRMGTDGKINLFERAEYHSLSKMFEQ